MCVPSARISKLYVSGPARGSLTAVSVPIHNPTIELEGTKRTVSCVITTTVSCVTTGVEGLSLLLEHEMKHIARARIRTERNLVFIYFIELEELGRK